MGGEWRPVEVVLEPNPRVNISEWSILICDVGGSTRRDLPHKAPPEELLGATDAYAPSQARWHRRQEQGSGHGQGRSGFGQVGGAQKHQGYRGFPSR